MSLRDLLTFIAFAIIDNLSYKKKHKAKRRKEKKTQARGTRRHCPPKRRRGDRNPECHEEQQKDVA
jgi:hypothetical protein